MNPSIERICEQILETATPKPDERKRVQRLAEKLRQRVAVEAERAGLEAEVKIGGSVAKDTWLSGEADIDVFMLVPTSLGRERLEKDCLDVAKKAVEGWPWTERYAEHPYLEAHVEGTRVNVVPCYRVKRGEWVSAADRTPFHTEYVKKKLAEKNLRDEIRLLKRFMRGVGVYGAEIRIGGFSGYLCELLVLNYRSFLGTLKAVSGWRRGHVIDVESFYRGRSEEIRKLFDAPLIVVDPVDKNRNVAAAVSDDRLGEFIAASRLFLGKPRETFFYPPETVPFEASDFRERLRARGTDIILMTFDGVDVVPDVLWGQLYRSLRSLKGLLRQYDFSVMRASAWSDEKTMNVLLFELESKDLSASRKHVGPPVDSKEAANFLEKHVGAESTVSGPWVEDGRWMIETKRKCADAVLLLREKLRVGGRDVGVASKLAESVRTSLKLLANEEIVDLCSSNPGFAKFLTGYLIGRPRWLHS